MNFLPFFTKFKISSRRGGFTLIELIVVVSISIIILTALVIQQGEWSDHLALNTQTYELALMIRQAQIYSLGVREYAAGAGDKFNVVYGVYFNTDEAEKDEYIFFVDNNRNYALEESERIETKTLTRGIEIDRLCGRDNAGNEKCSPQAGIRKVSVTFYRPQPEAIVKFLNPSDNTQDSVYPPTTIFLKSSQSGKEAQIRVENSGQISIVQ